MSIFNIFLFLMVSSRQIPVAGLELTVYGLDEYVPQTPVAVMFALHGRLGTYMERKTIVPDINDLPPNKQKRRRAYSMLPRHCAL